MIGISFLLAAGCLVLAVVAALAFLRARRAEAALAAAAHTAKENADPAPAAATVARTPDDRARHAQAMEDVGRTADHLAHDLKDVLTAITGRTELLIAGLDDEHPGRSDAYEIRRLALSAARIGRPLRALTDAGAATEPIDVNLVISHAAKAFPEMLGADIEVSLSLDPSIAHVRAGAGHIDEMVLRLAMKARADMPRGGSFTLSTQRHIEPARDPNRRSGERVRIVLTATSMTLLDVHREPIGAASAIAAGSDGAALGLSRVFEIVRQVGGSIAVDCTPGRGTTFVVDLPAATEPTDAAQSSPARTIAASVLVVEDEPRVRELIKAVLLREGHDVVAVAGPHDGLAVLKRQPDVELMLVDVVMPDMSGYDLAIHARSAAPGLRVIFMSAFAPDVTRQPAGDLFLAKPFAIETLHDVVRQALNDR